MGGGGGGPEKLVAWLLASQSTQFRWASVMWMVGTSAKDHRNPEGRNQHEPYHPGEKS